MKRITIQTVKNQGEFPLILLEREEWGQLADVFPEEWEFLQSWKIGLKKSLNRHLEVYTRLATIVQEPAPWEELITHTQRGLENVRQTHELVESLREAYQAAMDNRANEIMKFLTLLTTIFLPINLLTGFFGMNFEYMPLINNPNGIYFFGGISFSILLIILYYFHTKDWLR